MSIIESGVEQNVKVQITTAQALLIFIMVLIYCLVVLGVGTFYVTF